MREPEILRFAIASSSSMVRAGLAEGLAALGHEVALAAAGVAELREAGFGGAEVAIVVVADEADDNETHLDADLLASEGLRFVLLAADAPDPRPSRPRRGPCWPASSRRHRRSRRRRCATSVSASAAPCRPSSMP